MIKICVLGNMSEMIIKVQSLRIFLILIFKVYQSNSSSLNAYHWAWKSNPLKLKLKYR